MPDFTNYHMKGRTYKFIEGEPWYPFGYGLSYSKFTYDNLQVSLQENGLDVCVDVTNESERDGAEITQCYLRFEGDAFEKPHHKLVGFQRNEILANEKKTIEIHIPRKELENVLEDGTRMFLNGKYTLFVGGCQPDAKSIELTKGKVLEGNFSK